MRLVRGKSKVNGPGKPKDRGSKPKDRGSKSNGPTWQEWQPIGP